MTCADVEPLIGAYADGELDLERALAVEAHLAGCPACTARVTTLRSLSAAVRRAPYFSAPAALVSSVRPASTLSSQVRPSGPRSGGLLPWLVAAASVAIAIASVSALVLRRPTTSFDSTAQAVVASHVRSLMGDHLTDVTSTDRHTVKPWFAGRLDFSPVVVDLAADGFPLSGGRLEYVDGHAAAALVYKRGGHVINVIVWPVADADRVLRESSDPRGYRVLAWTRHQNAWWVVSDLAAAELSSFASKLMDDVDRAGG
jgi:anti-sigma factor RsiW